MKMLIVVPLLAAFPGPSAEEIALLNARTHGAEAKECLHVVDQDGLPVAGATVRGGLQTGSGRNDSIPIRGSTDTNGGFVIKGKCAEMMRCSITKAGYYMSEFRIDDYGHTHQLENGKWLPYGTGRIVVLKQMLNPKPMPCHNSLTSFKIPVYGEWLGFDFQKYDFVSPHGVGSEKDVLFRFNLDNPSRGDYHMTMEVSFTNSPFAGAYEMTCDANSELKSVYNADTNAIYRQYLVYRYDKYPDKVGKYSGFLSNDKYLVFRTRTKVDAEGRLVSALYGKIYGDWNFVGPGGMNMAQFVFNITPNDTNLEDLETAERSRMLQRQREEPPYRKKRKSLWPF